MSVKNSFEKYLENHLDLVQSFMDENITEGKPMTAGDIYENLKDKLPPLMNKAMFQSSLSINVRGGKISGFAGKKRIGYVKSDDANSNTTDEVKSESNVESESSETNNGLCVQVTKSIRIVNHDRYNFTMQKLNGNTWTNISYNSGLDGALKSTAKYLLKQGLKKDSDKVKTINDTVRVLREIEANIINSIVEKVGEEAEHNKGSNAA